MNIDGIGGTIRCRKVYETESKAKEKTMPEMNIMLFSSQKYFDYIYVMMCSLMENNPCVIVHLFIVSFQELEGKEGLNDFIESKGNRITYYVLDPNFVLPFQKGRITTRTGLGGLIRPIAHTFIEEQYDRMLFMDMDTVVHGDIYTEFYNLDFEDNYLITVKDSESFEKKWRFDFKKYDYDAALKGYYFNSALLLLNLDKLRHDFPYEKVIETFNSDDRIRNEQQLMNILYAPNVKYVDYAIYNARWIDVYKHQHEIETFMKEIRIFHYDTVYVPYKPWDILFEDEDYLEKISEMPIKPIDSDYKCFIINKFTNEFVKLWWDYAKKTPKYDKFYERMCYIREYFYSYTPLLLNSYNNRINRLDSWRNNINVDEVKKIDDIRKKEKLTWLNGINRYYGKPLYDYSYGGIDYQTVELNKYLESMVGNKDLVIFITSNITSHFMSGKLNVKEKLGLEFAPGFNESYLAIIDFKESRVVEKTGNSLIIKDYVIEDGKPFKARQGGITIELRGADSGNKIYVLLKSEGRNAGTSNSYNSILINNIEYAQKIRGINIVVFSRSRWEVIDKCYVNSPKMIVNR